MTQSEQGEIFKICIVTISLSSGGAERSTAHLSKMLTDEGYDVHIISIKDEVDYDYSGTLFSLGSQKKRFGILSTIKRLFKFRYYLEKNSFDLIIDNRTRPSSLKENVYSRFIYKSFKVIYVVRSSSLPMYFPKNKSIALNQASKSCHYVAVSNKIKDMIIEEYGILNVSCIYNPIPLKKIELQSQAPINSGEEKYIISMGRLDEPVKNYSLLLEAYKESKLSKQNIKLMILGKGPDENLIKEKIKKLELEQFVQMKIFTSNPFPWLKKAIFTVLTSRFEGFPRVLIESLSVGTPVVSVDCISGPSEIINHKENGLLISNNNKTELANAMDSLIFDEDLYNICKRNAKKSVSHLDIDIISKRWTQLLKDELH